MDCEEWLIQHEPSHNEWYIAAWGILVLDW